MENILATDVSIDIYYDSVYLLNVQIFQYIYRQS